MLLGLKASTDERQIRDRLQYHPDVFEFHLTEADFTASGWQHFLKMVAWVQSQVPTVVFHHPMRFRGQRNELAMNPTKYPARYDFLMTSSVKLMTLAKKVNATALIHGGYRVDTPGDYMWYLKTRCRQSLGMAILRLRRVYCAGGYHWLMILAILLSRYAGIMSDLSPVCAT